MSEQTKKHHSPSYSIYIFVWLFLLVLTGVTVAVAGINLGKMTLAIALLIASIKSYFVLTIFMHLKFEDRMFRIFVFVALFFLAISLILLFSDYSFQ
ncbi:MAG: cytochrome-c oxidase [Chlorobiaceae bacterium]|nr:cytochrome-c oxidase [Chlorobiaceae bacterium]MBA4309001.1 cytochrome-c oxidase [Chlorobiaceae bacterium]